MPDLLLLAVQVLAKGRVLRCAQASVEGDRILGAFGSRHGFSIPKRCGATQKNLCPRRQVPGARVELQKAAPVQGQVARGFCIRKPSSPVTFPLAAGGSV